MQPEIELPPEEKAEEIYRNCLEHSARMTSAQSENQALKYSLEFSDIMIDSMFMPAREEYWRQVKDYLEKKRNKPTDNSTTP